MEDVDASVVSGADLFGSKFNILTDTFMSSMISLWFKISIIIAS